METNFLKRKIQEQFNEEGTNLYKKNGEFIVNAINSNNSNDVTQVKVSDMIKGNFYFMFYDLQGKTSKMEKFNPLLIIDWFDIQNTRMVYAVSINFIPVAIRTLFFNNFLNYNLNIIEDNIEKNNLKQQPLEAVNFTNIYKLLASIGFEWSIRKFDIKKINKLYKISTNKLPEFITMSTARITGVDDGKLIEIWRKKITEQETRHKEIMKEILNNIENIDKELTDTYMSLDTRNDNLEESLQIIKKFL